MNLLTVLQHIILDWTSFFSIFIIWNNIFLLSHVFKIAFLNIFAFYSYWKFYADTLWINCDFCLWVKYIDKISFGIYLILLLLGFNQVIATVECTLIYKFPTIFFSVLSLSIYPISFTTIHISNANKQKSCYVIFSFVS